MTALTAARDTPMRRPALRRVFNVPAGSTVFAGSIGALDGGALKPASAVAALVVVGRVSSTVIGPGAAEVERGVFRFDNQADDAVTAADIGKSCYAVDDATVARTAGAGAARPRAGAVYDVDSDGVWVEFN